MKMLALILAAALAASCVLAPPSAVRQQPTPAAAQSDDWVLVFTAANGTEFALKRGSCVSGANGKSANYFYCLERIRPGKSSNFRYDAVLIDRDECKNGFGTLQTVSLDASTVYSSDQVVSGADSAGAIEFGTLCELSSRRANVTMPAPVPDTQNQLQPASPNPVVAAAAALTDWVSVGSDSDAWEYSLSTSSCLRKANASGVDYVVCTEKMQQPTGMVGYYFVALDAASCNRQNTVIYMGEAATGKQIGSMEVSFTGATVESKVAAALCAAAGSLGRPL